MGFKIVSSLVHNYLKFLPPFQESRTIFKKSNLRLLDEK
jgi:hypothetical protein